MRKKNVLCLALAAVLLAQSFAFAGAAAEVPEVTEAVAIQPTEEATEAPTELNIEEVPFGNAGVDYGCQTLDAKVSLGGGDRLLSTAKGVFVYETKSDTVLYDYQPDERLAPGGLVQIVTALLAIEQCGLDDLITVGTKYINELPLGVRHVNLRNGEEITVRDLLYCLMLYSANDAAVVLAQRVGGTPEQFVEMMNERVRELGCTNTVLTTVSGLDDPNQYTTARDMARILKTAMENETFRELFGTGTYYVEPTNKSEARELKTMNYFLEGSAVGKLYDERVTGGKVSYTSAEVGASIAFTAETEDLSLICVIIGATRRFQEDGRTVARYGNFEEATTLMDSCFGKFHARRLLYAGQTMAQIPVRDGDTQVVAVNNSSLDVVLPTGTNLDDLTLRYDIVGGNLQAPIQAGQEIAALQLWHDKCCVGETTLYAMSAVASAAYPGYVVQGGASRTDGDMVQMLMFMGTALMVLFILVAVYLVVISIRKSMARRRARKLRKARRDARMQQRRRVQR